MTNQTDLCIWHRFLWWNILRMGLSFIPHSAFVLVSNCVRYLPLIAVVIVSVQIFLGWNILRKKKVGVY